MSDYTYDEKERFDGVTIKVLGPTYEEGKPEGGHDWKSGLDTREKALDYLRTALRYWYGAEGFGSEKRKKEA
ncbi:MAG TPA: hypothetical protein VGJ94_00145 [Syntrophorhabdaceae bacterium]